MPPLQEQHAVADFLDRETARIDGLIAKKERQIALLQEKRSALISHVVTKGLHPNVRMKDSGIEWLGEIPAHWKLKRLKFMVRSIEQGWSPQCEGRLAEETEWGVLKTGCVNNGIFNEAEHKALPDALAPRREYEIKAGDILMSRANTKELLGSAALVENVRPHLLLCDKLYRLRVRRNNLNSAYLVYSLSAASARFQLERDATGTSGSMQNIGQDTVENFVALAPPPNEQEQIVRYLDATSCKLKNLGEKIRRSVAQLQEYRTALISAAVTGKIDVRKELS